MHDVVEVRPLKGYRLRLRFDDGARGIVDVSRRVPFDGVFAPLRDPEYFRRVRVEPYARHGGLAERCGSGPSGSLFARNGKAGAR